MLPEPPASSAEPGNAEGVMSSEQPAVPMSTQRVRHRPMRIFHLIMLVAALALTFAISPAAIRLIRKPTSGWGFREQLVYTTSLAMTVWTPVLALIALVGDRSRLRRASRSYGLSAILAAAAAILVLYLRNVYAGVLGFLRGYGVFPWYPESFFSHPVLRLLREAPTGAAAAVVAVWLILALTGAGRRPSDWFDRLCFLVGLAWVLWCLVGHDSMLTVPWLAF
jgi:hypothetical protein